MVNVSLSFHISKIRNLKASAGKQVYTSFDGSRRSPVLQNRSLQPSLGENWIKFSCPQIQRDFDDYQTNQIIHRLKLQGHPPLGLLKSDGYSTYQFCMTLDEGHSLLFSFMYCIQMKDSTLILPTDIFQILDCQIRRTIQDSNNDDLKMPCQINWTRMNKFQGHADQIRRHCTKSSKTQDSQATEGGQQNLETNQPTGRHIWPKPAA